ncbi:hypothetical protein [Novosphingobium sp. SG707]|uniref:hypothetical protein n=1 Tax=Novosphingobium sp. SG707 TaxID=2586996 RepID=UPI001446F61A|nr:hypothetical protein [Novosphingobium sp. SG707]
MNQIAQENRMEFGDRSGQTQDELQNLASHEKSVPTNDQIVNVSGYRGDFSFGAGNMGLPTQQISIGFGGDDAVSAKKFADMVVQKLATKWRIHEVPHGQGALPLSKCD